MGHPADRSEGTTAGPEVSVVIPTYNARRFVGRAIASVREQEGVRLREIVLVDDASTDGTPGLLAGYAAADPRIVLLSTPENRGPGPARNRGLDAVTAPWVAVLDADDAMRPDRLARMIDAAEAGGFDVMGDLPLYWRYNRGCPDDAQLPASGAVDEIGLREMLRVDPETGVLLMVIKPLFRTSLRHDGRLAYPDLRMGEDASLYLSMLLDGVRFGLLREALYVLSMRFEDGRHAGNSVTAVDYRSRAREGRKFLERLRDHPASTPEIEALVLERIEEAERKDRVWGWTMLRTGEWGGLGTWVRHEPRNLGVLGRIALAKLTGHRGPPT